MHALVPTSIPITDPQPRINQIQPWRNFARVAVHSIFNAIRKSAIEVVIRDPNGHWIKGSILKMMSNNATMLDLWAIYHGLLLAWREGLHSVVLMSSNKHVISILYAPTRCALLAENLILNCRKLMELAWILHIMHATKMENQVAAHMAKQGLQQQEELCILTRAPAFAATTMRVTHNVNL